MTRKACNCTQIIPTKILSVFKLIIFHNDEQAIKVCGDMVVALHQVCQWPTFLIQFEFLGYCLTKSK
jgi:hypothetical protein